MASTSIASSFPNIHYVYSPCPNKRKGSSGQNWHCPPSLVFNCQYIFYLSPHLKVQKMYYGSILNILFYLSPHLKVLKMYYGSILNILFYLSPHLKVLKMFLLRFHPQNSVLSFTSFKRVKSF